jgi:cob(I)alamin adenosyltransferase
MVRLTKITTKTGDDGYTSLVGKKRVSKVSPIIQAIGSIDEANSAIGMAFSMYPVSSTVKQILIQVQNDLFDLGADLMNPKHDSIVISEPYITRLEKDTGEFNKKVPALDSFILPSGNPVSALLHNARAVVRRAERDVWLAIEIHEHNDGFEINRSIPQYLNRLSDLLFVLARYTNNTREYKWYPQSML